MICPQCFLLRFPRLLCSAVGLLLDSLSPVHSVQIDDVRIVSCKYFWPAYSILRSLATALSGRRLPLALSYGRSPIHDPGCAPKVLLSTQFRVGKSLEANQTWNATQTSASAPASDQWPSLSSASPTCVLVPAPIAQLQRPALAGKAKLPRFSSAQVLDIIHIGLVFEMVPFTLNQILEYYTMRTMLLLAQPLRWCPPLCLAPSPP